MFERTAAFFRLFIKPGEKNRQAAAARENDIPEPVEEPQQAVTNRSIDFDFGPGFIFSNRPLSISAGEIDVYKSGERQELPAYRGCELALYTGGKYPRVLRLWKDIPTFDSGDREYDSWHVLYLAQEEGGNRHAVYCKGGYRLAGVQGFAKLTDCPAELKKYFES